MVSLGTFAQSACHWQEMTNLGLRKRGFEMGLGGTDCNFCDQKRSFFCLCNKIIRVTFY